MSEFDLNQLIGILRNCKEYKADHHMGRPFMSAYQIAIQYAALHPDHPLPVGGAGVGVHQSLAQRIARFLSMAIKNKAYPGLEGGFISHDQLKSMSFEDLAGNPIIVSTLDSGNAHAVFRVTA